jgi:membrane associated rhomboid family serine protease
MFPIRDHNPSGTTPYVTVALIVVNTLVFLGTWLVLTSNTELLRFFSHWALIPARVSAGQGYATFVTSMFLHGSWLHLFGNMLFLWIFGDNLEDAFGHLGFLAFYLAAGLVAAGAQFAGAPHSPLPMVGASGAIAGVMGGYMLLYPRARVDIVVIFVVILRMFVLPAWIVLGFWLGLQIASGLVVDAGQGGVAYSAHVGGFLAGLAMTLPLWLHRGGLRYWRRHGGAPPYAAAEYELTPTNIPVVRRRR